MIDKNQIFEWLQQFGSKPSIEEAEGAHWMIRGQFRDIPFVVACPKNDDRLVIQRALEIGEDELKKIRNADKEVRRKYIYTLKRDLLIRGVRYIVTAEDDVLTRLLLEGFVYEDGLTKDSFFKEFNMLTDATFLFFINTNRYFED